MPLSPTNPPHRSHSGAAPPVPDRVGQTSSLKQALMAFRYMEQLRDMSCFDGPAGSGKTTACSIGSRPVEWCKSLAPCWVSFG
jgi:hypothetical protein